MAYMSFSIDDLPEESSGYSILPEGWYSAYLTGVEQKPSQSSSGTVLHLQLTVTGPTNRGDVVMDFLNILNPNPTAERIGQGRLRSYLAAMGLRGVNDDQELLGHNVDILVDIEEREGGKGPRNIIKQVKPFGQGGASDIPQSAPKVPAAPPAPAVPSATIPPPVAPPWPPAAPSQAPGGTKPPWQK
jgi:hypothetical protein